MTTVPTPHLDGKHVVFGEVLDGKGIVRKIEDLKTQNDNPIRDIKIVGMLTTRAPTGCPRAAVLTNFPVDCGQLTGDAATGAIKKIVDDTGDPYEDFPEDQGEEFKGPQIVKIANELKEYGNKAFKAGDISLGLDKYQKGLRYLNEYPAALDGDPPELAHQLTNIRFTLHSNSALLQNKLKAYDDAEKSASNALDLGSIPDNDKAKAYYRRALAKAGLKDDEEAIKDLEAASKLAPGDVAITKELATVKKRAADREKKEKAAFKKFFQ